LSTSATLGTGYGERLKTGSVEGKKDKKNPYFVVINAISMKSTDSPIVVKHTFNTSVQKVWSAITDLNEMRQWYFNQIDDFRPEVGFKTQFVVQIENRVFTHLWEVNQVIPQQKITYNWKFLEYPGNGDVTFELIPENDGVKLRLM